MNTIILSRAELQQIIVDALEFNAENRAFIGNLILEEDFESVADDIVESILLSQDDYDGDDDDDDEVFEFDFLDFDEDDDEEDDDFDFDDEDEEEDDDA